MPVVPVLPVLVAGAPYPSSSISAMLAVQAFLLKPPQARLRQIVSQSLPNGVPTALTFTAFDVDTDYLGNQGHSNSVNPSRYTVNWPGQYECSGGVSFNANATGARGCYWAVSGTRVLGCEVVTPTTPGGPNHGSTARGELIYLNIGDYVELWGYQTSGAPLTTIANLTEAASTLNIIWRSN